MLLYRITNDNFEVNEYLKGNIIFNKKETLFYKKRNNCLYEVNTFIYDDKIYKHFYYFPQDAYEIAKILLKLSCYKNKKNNHLSILEYSIDNLNALNKVGFGNYNCLKRMDYVNEDKIYKIKPFENSSYPVLEFRFLQSDNISVTKKIWSINAHTPLPDDLNDLKKLKQLIYYKLHCETILKNLGVNYPHGLDGLMRISKHYDNVKEIEIPKCYLKILY